MRFCLIIFVCSYLFSSTEYLYKEYFNLIINSKYIEEPYHITEGENDSLLLISSIKVLDKKKKYQKTFTSAFNYLNSVKENSNNRLKLLQLDNNVKILYEKILQDHNLAQNPLILEEKNNKYYFNINKIHKNKLMISKINKKGILISQKIYQFYKDLNPKTIINLDQSEILLVAKTRTNINKKVFKNGIGGEDILLVKFNKFGNEIINKTIGTIYNDNIISAIQKENNGILLTYTYSFNNKKYLNINILDNKLNKTKNINLNINNNIIKSKSLKLNDNTYILINSYQNGKVQILNIDKELNIINNKIINNEKYLKINDAIVLENNKIFLVGFIINKSKDGFIGLYTKEGEKININIISASKDDEFKMLKLLKNNSIAIIGKTNSYKNNENKIWIVKVHKNTNLLRKIVIEKNQEDLYKELKKSLKKYNIEIKKDLNIRFKNKILNFEQNSYQLKEENKKFIKSFFKDLINILYNKDYKNKIKNIRINGFSSSEWIDVNKIKGYINNSDLSIKRAFEVLKEIIRVNYGEEKTNWLINVLSVDGYSYSKLIKKKVLQKDKEDKENSRRVEIEISFKEK